ncbi:MAG: RNA 2',3'-cyclic phosphodiesterase [Betaproteobacteria bacterium]|nr:RNA 2',3'-cyclic phosphodiesterase [Betaproteobacteria bacterium]
MRLFFALWPAPGTAAALALWAAKAQRETGGRAARAEAIHLTLAFLGETEDARLSAAIDAARSVRCAPHALPIEQARHWKRQSIVWVGPNETPAPLVALAADLKSALMRAGFAIEARPFEAHVTLIRKARAPRALPPLPVLDWPVDEFLLVRSTLSNEGSSYTILERFPLGA